MRKLMGLVVFFIIAGTIIMPALIIAGLRLLEAPVETQTGERLVRVYLHRTGVSRTFPLEEYLVGVVAGEMPANFEVEALKAQAIAARTYTLKKIEQAKDLPGSRHENADICTDATHCQAWLDEASLRQQWGLVNYWRYHKRIKDAVNATRGLVLTYQGKLIEPVYHSNGGGRTESAAAVWGGDIPYLQSVASPWDRESPHYRDSLSFSLQELENKLGVNLSAVPAAALAAPSGSAMKVIEQTPTGRVKTIVIGDKTFAATELRQLLGLPSTDFSWEVAGEQIIFTTIGYGHAVGMSQYGANGMAAEGKKFNEILSHYYQGVKIERVY
ncbi:MAG: stage II sporulation protein D [Clostridia bacterium]|nr:stage II sporulation protein D [Clostridia bacterium]